MDRLGEARDGGATGAVDSHRVNRRRSPTSTSTPTSTSALASASNSTPNFRGSPTKYGSTRSVNNIVVHTPAVGGVGVKRPRPHTASRAIRSSSNSSETSCSGEEQGRRRLGRSGERRRPCSASSTSSARLQKRTGGTRGTGGKVCGTVRGTVSIGEAKSKADHGEVRGTIHGTIAGTVRGSTMGVDNDGESEITTGDAGFMEGVEEVKQPGVSVALPDGWAEGIDEETGHTYYYSETR